MACLYRHIAEEYYVLATLPITASGLSACNVSISSNPRFCKLLSRHSFVFSFGVAMELAISLYMFSGSHMALPVGISFFAWRLRNWHTGKASGTFRHVWELRRPNSITWEYVAESHGTPWQMPILQGAGEFMLISHRFLFTVQEVFMPRMTLAVCITSKYARPSSLIGPRGIRISSGFIPMWLIRKQGFNAIR